MSEVAAAKKTIGEELFLVHLNRFQEKTESDFDHEDNHPRKLAMSVGEELWRVHCKRQTGIEEEGDLENVDKEPEKKKAKPGEDDDKKEEQQQVKVVGSNVIHHLRNRDVEIP